MGLKNMSKFRSYWTTYKKITKNKNFESQLLYSENSWALCVLSWSRKTHHSGLSFRIGIFGLELHIKFYDSRHWDYKNNCYSNMNEKPITTDLT